MKKAGIFTIIVGFGLIIFTSFFTFPKNKVVNIKQVAIDQQKAQSLNWYPLFSIAVFVVGTAILGRSSES